MDWIITFKKGTAEGEIERVVDQVVAAGSPRKLTSTGGQIGHRYSGITILGFSCKNLPQAKANEIKSNPHVSNVEADGQVHAL